jgi:hypothetical protein
MRGTDSRHRPGGGRDKASGANRSQWCPTPVKGRAPSRRNFSRCGPRKRSVDAMDTAVRAASIPPPGGGAYRRGRARARTTTAQSSRTPCHPEALPGSVSVGKCRGALVSKGNSIQNISHLPLATDHGRHGSQPSGAHILVHDSCQPRIGCPVSGCSFLRREGCGTVASRSRRRIGRRFRMDAPARPCHQRCVGRQLCNRTLDARAEDL